MRDSIKECTVLNNGVNMPWLGLGVWQMTDEEATSSIKIATKIGYRSIDTAAIYGNESGVGRGIKECGIPREELFITTKLWNENQANGYDAIMDGFEQSLRRLQLEYVDLYLIHWPVGDKYIAAWRAMIDIYKSGRARAIGVSNFDVNHLEDIIKDSGVVPAVNQVEYHPLNTRPELYDYCKSNNIQLEAYSPLMRGNVNSVPLLKELAEKYGKTPAQIVLRWDIQKDVVAIPKATHERHIKENADIFDFELSQEDMERISGLNQNKRFL